MEEMLYSDEAFAGGLSQQKMNGNFRNEVAQALTSITDRTRHVNLTAISSDGMIVCLGSDIENTNTEFSTETTIFNWRVTDKAGHDYWKNYQEDKKVWVDHLGNRLLCSNSHSI